MKYKDKFTGKTVEAIYIENNIASIRKALKLIGIDAPEDNTSGYAFHYTVLAMMGIKLNPYKVAHIGEYVVKCNDGSLGVFQKYEFKKCFEPIDRMGDIIVHVDLQADEYLALLKEAEQTAEKLKGLLGRLNNYRIESNQSNDRLRCTYILKPGK